MAALRHDGGSVTTQIFAISDIGGAMVGIAYSIKNWYNAGEVASTSSLNMAYRTHLFMVIDACTRPLSLGNI